jgi:hypothetical protein
MKNIIKSSFVLFIAVLMILSGCNEDFKSTYGFNDFAQWSVATRSVDENATSPLVLTIQLVGPQRSTPTNVSFNVIEANLVEGIDYTFPNGKNLVIPANSSTATITILPIDNSDISEVSRTITLELTSVDDYDVSLGNKSIVVSINEDDFWCPRNQLSNAVATEYDLGYSTTSVSIEKSLTPDGCLRFDILGGGSSLFGTGDVRINGVIITEDSPESLTGTINDATFQFFRLDNPTTNNPLASGGGEIYTMVITNGTYDLELGTFQFDYLFYRGTTLLYPGTLIYE